MDVKDIENRFTYHKPKNDQPGIYEIIRAYGKDFALYLNKVCPESREKEMAITKLEEAVMWANASIARNE
jgi:hypothetical protein